MQYRALKLCDVGREGAIAAAQRIFEQPVPKNLIWVELESLLMALGAKRVNRVDQW